MTFQNVVEKVVYKVNEDNPEETVAIRSAWIDSQVFGFSRAIRKFGVERFKKNCGKMVNIFSFTLYLCCLPIRSIIKIPIKTPKFLNCSFCFTGIRL